MDNSTFKMKSWFWVKNKYSISDYSDYYCYYLFVTILMGFIACIFWFEAADLRQIITGAFIENNIEFDQLFLDKFIIKYKSMAIIFSLLSSLVPIAKMLFEVIFLSVFLYFLQVENLNFKRLCKLCSVSKIVYAIKAFISIILIRFYDGCSKPFVSILPCSMGDMLRIEKYSSILYSFDLVFALDASMLVFVLVKEKLLKTDMALLYILVFNLFWIAPKLV